MAEPPHPLLKAITLEGFLSLGDATEDFPLEPLSVAIEEPELGLHPDIQG